MKIGFDIDDTLARFSFKLLQLGQAFDSDFPFAKRGIVDKSKYITKGLFAWTEVERNRFEKEAIFKAIPQLRPDETGLELLKILKDEGHEIFLITARTFDKYSTKKQTLRWLKENNVIYDKLILGVQDKERAIKDNKIDVFIDDRKVVCEQAEKTGVFAIQKNNAPIWQEKYKNYASTWQEVYDQICKKCGHVSPFLRAPMIVDTDVTNEIDDEFALAYLFSLKADIRAITIAPHFSLNQNELDVKNNVERSYQKATQIASLCKSEMVKKIYRGCPHISDYGVMPQNDAVKKIIEICEKNEKVIFVALGSMINLAEALRIKPQIASKIKLFTLMGILAPNGLSPEYNMSQDFNATKIVLSKIIDKVIFPVNVTDSLVFDRDMKPLSKSKIAKLLQRDFKDVCTNKFDCRFKSMFDVAVIDYLVSPLDYNSQDVTLGFNNTNITFKKSKNNAKIVTKVDVDNVTQRIIKGIKSYEN